MNMNQIILLALIAGLVVACKNQDTETNPAEHLQHAEQLTLNNGERWVANAETTEGIKKMTLLLGGLSDASPAEDYESTKAELEKEFETILKKCTMTGKAHEQLHIYLLPMKDMMSKFNSTRPEERKEALKQLDRHLREYETFFQ
jgi:hypothetical protein